MTPLWNKTRVALIAGLALAAVAGCGNASSKNLSQIVFDRESFEFVVPDNAPLFETSIPFTVQGAQPVRVASIEKSCQCAEAGEGMIDIPLHPGKKYDLPVRIKIGGKTDFSVVIRLLSDQNQTFECYVRGVVASPPKSVPSVITAEFKRGSKEQLTGKFVVYRTRSSSADSLKPLSDEIEGRYVRIRFLKHSEPLRPKGAIGADAPVIDALEWMWEMKNPPEQDCDEHIEIAWENEGIDATDLPFRYVGAPLVPGLVDALFCGRLPKGEKWSHTLTLRVPLRKGGDIEAVTSDQPFVSCRIERKDEQLVHVHIDVEAPSVAGEFSATLQFRFADPDVPVSSVRVFGIVKADH